jgi:imidazolonepropionase
MKLLIKNIRSLVFVEEKPVERLKGKEMGSFASIDDAWLAVDDGLISDFGSMKDFPGISDWSGLEVLDATDKLILPAFCDSHTHIVYAASREGEFVDRINGLTYEEIAMRGGGILNSVKKLRAASEAELFASAKFRVETVIKKGTGALEIKSGYGLSLESELKMLRVIKRLKEHFDIPIRSTFLGAHAIPLEFGGNKAGYVDHLINEMLPAVAAEKLADYCDIFCERNYFDTSDTLRLLEAASKLGIKGKVHAEQLSHAGGIQAGVKAKAVSVDHLEYMNDEDISVLKKSNTIPTLLPGAQFFLQLPHPPARKMIDAGLAVAVASDYNPGSSPSGDMKFMIALCCIQYRMTPEEAIIAATLNGAAAMELSKDYGSIARGKKANLILTTEIPSYTSIPYGYNDEIIDTVFINGKPFSNFK